MPLEVLDRVRNDEPLAIRKQRSNVLQDLETICLKCLQKQPEDRYASAQALADDLKRFLDGKDVLARPVALHQRLIRWCRRPQRLREAGLTAIAVNSILEGWTIFAALAITSEWVPRASHVSTSAVLQQTVPINLFVQPPLILAGWWDHARQAMGHQARLGDWSWHDDFCPAPLFKLDYKPIFVAVERYTRGEPADLSDGGRLVPVAGTGVRRGLDSGALAAEVKSGLSGSCAGVGRESPGRDGQGGRNPADSPAAIARRAATARFGRWGQDKGSAAAAGVRLRAEWLPV